MRLGLKFFVQKSDDAPFCEDCKSIRPRCPTCTELDSLAFAGMDAIINIDRDRTMVQHLRRRVQHCGLQAARADKLAFNWHREGNNAYLMMHHFNMAHIEADRRRQLQPPISKPTPRVKGPSEITERLTYRRGRDNEGPEVYQTSTPEGQSAATPAVTVTRITQVEQHVPLAEAAPPRAYTAAVKEGKRSSSGYSSSSMSSTSLPPPHQDNKCRNMSLLDPNYDAEREHQQSYDNLQTPRPSYSPVKLQSVEEFSQPSTPGTTYMVGAANNNADQQISNYNPADHLARLASQNETTMECVQLHH